MPLSYLFYFVHLRFLILTAPYGLLFGINLFYPLDIATAPVGCCVDFLVNGSAAPPLGPIFFFFFAPVWYNNVIAAPLLGFLLF